MRLLMYRRDDVKRLGVLVQAPSDTSETAWPHSFDVIDVAGLAASLAEPFPFGDLLALIRGGSGPCASSLASWRSAPAAGAGYAMVRTGRRVARTRIGWSPSPIP
jgi:hypothetical protein